MSRELEAARASLRQVDALLASAQTRRTPPWTAIAQMIRTQAKLAADVARLEAADEQSEKITPDRLRTAILRLPPELVPVAEEALAERKRR